ncbi:hypothetical protein VKS41_005628 [Umbelopsis sp. WA50703]
MTENRTAEWISFAVSRAGDIPVIGGRIRKVSMTYGPRPSITQSSPSRLSTSSDTQPPPSYSTVERNSLVVANEINSKSIIERISSKQLTKLDRQSIIQGLRMVELAAVEYQEGNDTIALDIYLHGLDKIVMGLPVESDPDTRKALESKLRLLERKLELPSTFQSVQEVQMIANLKSFSDLIVHITVSCAQLIKASPVPGVAFSFIKGSYRLIRLTDTKLRITQRIQELLIYLVKVILDIDEKYQIHQLLTECVHMLFVASIKASIAFKESPGYHRTSTVETLGRTPPVQN